MPLLFNNNFIKKLMQVAYFSQGHQVCVYLCGAYVSFKRKQQAVSATATESPAPSGCVRQYSDSNTH